MNQEDRGENDEESANAWHKGSQWLPFTWPWWPAVFGSDMSQLELCLFTLPARMGGMGVLTTLLKQSMH